MNVGIALFIGLVLLAVVLGAAGVRASPSAEATFFARCQFSLAGFTIGAQTGSGSGATRNVAVQLKDFSANVAKIVSCEVYLSDSADGHTITATAPTSIAIGTNGVVIGTLTSAKAVQVITNASGQFDLTITESATPNTYFLVVCLPDGSIVVSSAIVMT